MTLIRTGLALALALAATPGWTQQTLEILGLRHRTAEQVLPVLRPLLEPGGTLTGQSGKLIVRASPANVEDLRRALEAIDRPARRLQVSVRFDGASQGSSRDVGAGVAVGDRDARVVLHGTDQRAAASESVDQRLQVLEGGRAYIATGRSQPLRQRQVVRTPGGGVVVQETQTLQDLATGFEVVPRVSGTTVWLDVNPRREIPGSLPGSVDSQHVATTVSGRLGEWIDLGGVEGGAARDERGILSSGRAQGSEYRRISVKVEEIGP